MPLAGKNYLRSLKYITLLVDGVEREALWYTEVEVTPVMMPTTSEGVKITMKTKQETAHLTQIGMVW